MARKAPKTSKRTPAICTYRQVLLLRNDLVNNSNPSTKLRRRIVFTFSPGTRMPEGPATDRRPLGPGTHLMVRCFRPHVFNACSCTQTNTTVHEAGLVTWVPESMVHGVISGLV